MFRSSNIKKELILKAKKPPKKNVVVSVVMGSDSDLSVMAEATKILQEFAVPHELFLTSAHRTPERTTKFAKEAAQRGVQIIIVGAGAAAHLAGVIASQTQLPIIGVPIDATAVHGLDALLSTVPLLVGIFLMHDDEGTGQRETERHAVPVHQRDGGEAPEHREHAMCEVHEPHQPHRQRETDGDHIQDHGIGGAMEQDTDRGGGETLDHRGKAVISAG